MLTLSFIIANLVVNLATLIAVLLMWRRQWLHWRHFAAIVHGYAEAVRDYRDKQVLFMAEGVDTSRRPATAGPKGMKIKEQQHGAPKGGQPGPPGPSGGPIAQ